MMRLAFPLFKNVRAGLVLLTATLGLAAAEPRLHVTYGDQSKDLVAADLAKLPKAEIEAKDHEKSHRYSGVTVHDVLALVGAPLDQRLRGGAMALVVKARASDGYVVAFALAEFDANHREQPILLVDQQDGVPLAEKVGPLRLVCPGDKRGARWIHQVISLEVVSLTPERAVKP